MPKNPFKPLCQRKPDVSQNPKTVLNRSYVSTKCGLDIALYRNQKAFRVAESWELKRLHDQAGWDQLNKEEREKAEKVEIDVLIANKRQKVEAGDISKQAWQTEPSQLGLACLAWYEPSQAEIFMLGPKPSRSPPRLVHCQAEQAWSGLGLLSLLSSGRCSTQINDSTRVKAILCATKFLD